MSDQERSSIACGNDTIHRFGPNSFKLQSLPVPRAGHVLGLVGSNGIGKSTSLKLLSGKLKPNLGRFNNPPDWPEILDHFKGTELQNYFTRVLEENFKVTMKTQYVYQIPNLLRGNVGQVLSWRDTRDMKQELAADLELIHLMDRNLGYLSGGELQRFAIALAATQNADICLFDEPSAYLDVKQRLKAAQVVRSLVRPNNYVIVVEHDLSVLDYLSDFICCFYGKPGQYGVVTLPFSVREGINIFLAEFVQENLRLRVESLTFKKLHEKVLRELEAGACARYKYPTMTLTHGRTFRLKVVEGEFTDSQIIVLLGENGTGKTTFLRMLAGLMEPGSVKECEVEIPKFNVSYKPQRIVSTDEYTVRSLFHSQIRHSYMDPQFVSDVMEPLLIRNLMDKKLVNLSRGEMQRVALTCCLGKPADIYLIDEPSTYLDSEQRIIASKVIKKFIHQAKKTAFVVEHDFIMATYLADRVIVCEGKPSIDCVTNSPQSLLTGMNRFLSTNYQQGQRDNAAVLLRKLPSLAGPVGLRKSTRGKRSRSCLVAVGGDNVATETSDKDTKSFEASDSIGEPSDNASVVSPSTEGGKIEEQSRAINPAEEGKPSSNVKRASLTARERLRAARVLSRYTDSKPSKPMLGSRLLDALQQSDKGKKRPGLPEAPTNMLDDSKRGMPKEGWTIELPGGMDVFFIILSFVLISTVMFATTFIVWKVGAIHFNEY